MGLFDRLKKKKRPDAPAGESWPQPPAEDTMCLLLMDRVLEDIAPAVELLRGTFGAEAVGEVDDSHPRVPAFIVTLDGLELWCSYLPMPVPQPETDIAQLAQYSSFLTPEERAAFGAHRSFWVLAQKGGGKTLADKRRACWTLSLLCAALLELEGAVGVCVPSSRLLVSRANYRTQRANMEGKSWHDPDYFPVPLWVWLFRGTKGESFSIETWGLKEFGLPELGFFNPKLPAQDILDYLFTMSCFQITGRQLYRNMALIPLTPELEVVCKQEDGKLYFIGA